MPTNPLSVLPTQTSTPDRAARRPLAERSDRAVERRERPATRTDDDRHEIADADRRSSFRDALRDARDDGPLTNETAPEPNERLTDETPDVTATDSASGETSDAAADQSTDGATSNETTDSAGQDGSTANGTGDSAAAAAATTTAAAAALVPGAIVPENRGQIADTPVTAERIEPQTDTAPRGEVLSEGRLAEQTNAAVTPAVPAADGATTDAVGTAISSSVSASITDTTAAPTQAAAHATARSGAPAEPAPNSEPASSAPSAEAMVAREVATGGGDESLADRQQRQAQSSQETLPTQRRDEMTAAQGRAVQVQGAVELENATGLAAQPATGAAERLVPETTTTRAEALTDRPGADRSNNVSRIVRGMSTMVNARGGTMTMRLTPNDLGEIKIQMTVRSGRVTVDMMTTNHAAHATIEKSIGALRAALESQGLAVERIGVQSEPSSSREQNSASNQNNQGRESTGDAGHGRSRGRRDDPAGQEQRDSWHPEDPDDFAGFMTTEEGSEQ